jgi:cell division protein FtsA
MDMLQRGAIIREMDILIKGVGARGNTKIPISLLTQIISLRMKRIICPY